MKPAVQHLIDELKVKEEKYMKTVKVGRTHLQDAVPLTFGQELSGYIASLEHDLDYIKTLESTLDELAIGGDLKLNPYRLLTGSNRRTGLDYSDFLDVFQFDNMLDQQNYRDLNPNLAKEAFDNVVQDDDEEDKK